MKKLNLGNINAGLSTIKELANENAGIARDELIDVSLIDFANKNTYAANDTDDSIRDLADQIETVGLLNPLGVIQSGNRYKLFSGERRYRAITQYLHWDKIPCRIFEGVSAGRAQLMLHIANGGRDYTAEQKLTLYEEYRELLNNKTEYNKTDSQSDGNFDFLMNADVPEDFAKACISLICEITTTPLSTVRIGKQVLPSAQVRQALHSLTPEHLQAVYRITKYSNNVRKPKGYLLALLYNAAQAAPESNLYAQFFAMPPEEHKPSFDIKLYEKYDIFDYLNEERSPEHET